MRTAIVVLFIGGVSLVQADTTECPQDMLQYLGKAEDTKLAMSKTVSRCSDKFYEVTGKVIDIKLNKGLGGEQYEVTLRSEPIEGHPFSDRWYDVTLAPDHLCGDLEKITKDSRIKFKARFSDFGGYGNRWASCADAVCE